MAEFIPWAGFSPSCRDVFVQTEHWAPAVDASSTAAKSNIIMKEILLIACKGKAAGCIRALCLTEIKEQIYLHNQR